MATRFVAFVAILSVVNSVFAQSLSLSECAIQCTTEITTQSSSCRDGLQCFCADEPLFQLGIDCWKENCTIREGLVARNITSLQCNIPDRDRGAVGTAVTFASMGVALVFVAMQVIVFTTIRHWGWDDILMVLATILMVLNAAANPIARKYGFGKDVWRIPFTHTSTVMKIFYIGGIIYAVAVAVTKMAFLCFYIRLFPRSALQKWAYPILVITFIQGTVFTFLFIFQCSPVSYAWTSWDGESEGKCLNFDVGAVLHAIFNIVLDFIIFLLPIRQMWQLNLSHKKRTQVLLMFAVGFFVTVVSILRLVSLIQLEGSTNPPYDYIPLGYWSDLELNIGIACLCMPSARVMLRRYFPDCRLATTANDSRSDMYVRSSNLRHENPGGGIAKIPRGVTRPVVAKDSSSDQVELFSVNGPEGRIS